MDPLAQRGQKPPSKDLRLILLCSARDPMAACWARGVPAARIYKFQLTSRAEGAWAG